MKRFRISTLMFVVVIAALVVALAIERRRSARQVAEMQVERANARMSAEVALAREQALRALAGANDLPAEVKASVAKAVDQSSK